MHSHVTFMRSAEKGAKQFLYNVAARVVVKEWSYKN